MADMLSVQKFIIELLEFGKVVGSLKISCKDVVFRASGAERTAS